MLVITETFEPARDIFVQTSSSVYRDLMEKNSEIPTKRKEILQSYGSDKLIELQLRSMKTGEIPGNKARNQPQLCTKDLIRISEV